MSKDIIALIANYGTDEEFEESTCIHLTTNLQGELESSMRCYRNMLDGISDYEQHEMISDVVESCVRAAKQSAYADGFRAGIALVVEAVKAC